MESHKEQIARVEMMTNPDSGTWDLSDNDVAALKTVLKERAELLFDLKEMVAAIELEGSSGVRFYEARNSALVTIARAEGRA